MNVTIGTFMKRFFEAFGKRFQNSANMRILHDSFLIAAGYATTIFAGIASIRIFTELVPASVFGGANLMLGLLTLGTSAMIAPMSQTQIRYFMKHQQSGNGTAYTRVIARYTFFAVMLLMILSTTALSIFPSLRAGASIWIVAFIALWLTATALRAVLIGPVQAERRMRRYAAWVASEAIFMLSFTTIALKFFPSIEAYIAGQAVAVLGAVAIFSYKPSGARRETQFEKLKAETHTQIVKYGLPFLPLAILVFLYNQADRFVLAGTFDTAVVGTYAAAFAIASRIPLVIGTVITDVFRPILFEAEDKKEFFKSKRIFAFWIFLMFFAASCVIIFFYLFGDIVAKIFLAPDYRTGAKEIMLLIAISFGFNSISQVLEVRILSYGQSSRLIWTKMAGGTANIAWAWVLIPPLGAFGAGLANVLGQVVLFIAVAITLQRAAKRVQFD